MSAETPGIASDKGQNAEAPIPKTPPPITIPPFEKGGPGGIWNLEAIQLLTNHLEIWTSAETEKKSGRGRSSGNGTSVYGIKKLRELILELVVHGKLVPQDPDDEPAGELIKRIQAEKAKLIGEGKIKKDKPLPPISDEEKPFELPQGWEWVRLGVLTKKLTDGSHNPPKDAGEGFPMLSSQNVNFGKIDFESPSRYVSEEDFEIENSRTRIESGDVLLTIVASLGRPAVVPDNAPKFVLQRSVAVIKTDLFAEFLCLHLGSPLCLRFYDIHGKGTAQKGIYLGQLSEMPIAVPPFSEQHRIVAKVDELMALCDQLETQHINAAEAHEKLVNHLLGTLTQSHSADDFNANWQRIAAHFDTLFTTEASIDALKQTLLQLAVMGKLVPQDSNDEPASELLKRIQAEKTKLMAEGKIKKGKSPLAPLNPPPAPLLQRGELNSAATTSSAISSTTLSTTPSATHQTTPSPSTIRPTTPPFEKGGLGGIPGVPVGILGSKGISDEKKPFELPQGWEWVRLGSVLEITGGVTLGRKISSADLVELPYLRVANVQRGYLVLDSIKTVEIQYSELSRYQLLRGDLLVTEGGDWDKIGRTAIWNAEIENCLHQNHIFRMRRITEGLSSSWIQMYMNSIAKAYFQASSKQTTNLASINMTQLKNCLLAVPTLREQHRIVTKVDELMTLCDQLKSRITQASQLQKKLADVVVEQAIAS